jgi:hypothetical protein
VTQTQRWRSGDFFYSVPLLCRFYNVFLLSKYQKMCQWHIRRHPGITQGGMDIGGKVPTD